jgi:hypothetical protein
VLLNVFFLIPLLTYVFETSALYKLRLSLWNCGNQALQLYKIFSAVYKCNRKAPTAACLNARDIPRDGIAEAVGVPLSVHHAKTASMYSMPTSSCVTLIDGIAVE